MTIIFYITSKAFRVFPLQRPSSTLFQSYKDLVYKKISRNSNDLEPYFFFLTDSSYFFFSIDKKHTILRIDVTCNSCCAFVVAEGAIARFKIK